MSAARASFGGLASDFFQCGCTPADHDLDADAPPYAFVRSYTYQAAHLVRDATRATARTPAEFTAMLGRAGFDDPAVAAMAADRTHVDALRDPAYYDALPAGAVRNTAIATIAATIKQARTTWHGALHDSVGDGRLQRLLVPGAVINDGLVLDALDYLRTSDDVSDRMRAHFYGAIDRQMKGLVALPWPTIHWVLRIAPRVDPVVTLALPFADPTYS
jgi:hypothetical protein